MKIWSLPTAVVIVTASILALGILRLAQDEPQRTSVTREQATALSECLPIVEVPATVPVSILPFVLDSAQGAPKASAPDGKVDNGQGGVSTPANGQGAPPGARLTVVATGPLQVRPSDKLPDAGGEVTLDKQTLVITRANGPFELRLESGTVLIRNGDAKLLLKDAARFGGAENVSYRVEVPDKAIKAAVKQVNNDKQVVVSPGTTIGTIDLGAGQSVVPMQPLSTAIWMAGTPSTLTPVRVSGQPGLADLAIETEKAGLRTEKSGTTLLACAIKEYTDGQGKPGAAKWTRAGVSGVTTSPGKATLSLPSDLLPALSDFRTRLGIAMATSDGKSVAIGGGVVFGRLYAAGLATVLTGILLGLVMFHRGQQVKASDNSPRWFAGLFIGPDNDPSLSLLQVFIWTTITLWGFFYVFFVAGKLLSLTPEMMQLLGIAGAGTVLARWIAVSGGGSTSQAAPSSTASGPAPAPPPDFWRMLSTNGNFDLLKFQLFAFTVVIAMYVVWRIADAAAFPTLDANTLLLLGVSQGVYVTSKLAGASALAKAQAIKASIDANQETVKNLESDKATLAATKAGLSQKVTAAGAAVPSDLQTALDDTTARLTKLDGQLSAATTSITALEMDYDRALAALGLKRA